LLVGGAGRADRWQVGLAVGVSFFGSLAGQLSVPFRNHFAAWGTFFAVGHSKNPLFTAQGRSSWAELWSLGKVAAFTLIAMLAYGVQALVFSWFCRLTGIPVSVAETVLIFTQATLFGAASMVPGGLGVMEAALVVQLVAQGADQGVALSVAIATRLATFWLGFFIGFFALLLSTKSWANAVKKVKIRMQ
jgi:glycosyltransferase 2 family protein